MFTQDDINAVLQDAQQAVESLSNDVSVLVADGSAEPARGAGTASSKRPAARRAAGKSRSDETKPAAHLPERVRRILKLSVPLVIRLARRPMSVREILRIDPGTILEFDRTVDCELDLMINNCLIGSGIAVKVGENFGLRITRIGDVEQRIHSLVGR